MNLGRLFFLALVGGGAVAYWRRDRIFAYIANAAKTKLTTTVNDYLPEDFK